jgi:hypothetical protein
MPRRSTLPNHVTQVTQKNALELIDVMALVVARTLRLLALTADSDAWRVWTQGYRETLDLLEADDRPGAVARYRQIFVEYRTVVENMLFAGENNQS